MERRGRIMLLFFLCLTIFSMMSELGSMSYTEVNDEGRISLSVSTVSLGNLKIDYTDPRRRRGYFEIINGFPVAFQGYGRRKHSWEVQIYADDFMNETGDVISVSKLRWKKPNGVYRVMPGFGNYDRVAASSDYNGNDRWDRHELPLSLHLALTGDEYAGVYQSTIHVSIISY